MKPVHPRPRERSAECCPINLGSATCRLLLRRLEPARGRVLERDQVLAQPAS